MHIYERMALGLADLRGTDVAILNIAIVATMLDVMIAMSLLIFHTYLAASGWTAWELLQREHVWYLAGWTGEVSPFGLGILRNFKAVFLHGRIPKEWVIRLPEDGSTGVAGEDEELPAVC